jgi:hypothetical protein
MKVYECGTEVKGKIGGWWGIIVAVVIRFDTVYYEINTSKSETATMHECEFICEKEKVEIGFKKK